MFNNQKDHKEDRFMKVAIVINELNIKGGAQRQALELAANLQKMGITVDVFSRSFDSNICYTYLTKNINIYSLEGNKTNPMNLRDFDSFVVKSAKIIYNMFYFKKVNKSLVELIKIRSQEISGYDVINYHDDMVSIVNYFPSIKSVWMMNDLPTVLIDYERNPLGFRNITKKIALFVSSIWFKCLIRRVDRVIVLDKRNKHLVKKYFGKIANVVRSGVDIKKFDLININKKTLNKLPTVLAVNIFYRYRRYEDVIEALNILINIKKVKIQLNIIGKQDTDLDYFKSIRKLVHKYRLEKFVNFLGVVSETQLLKEYKNADIFVFPNHNQTWGLSVFEAMLNYCACVVSKSSGAHEVLRNEYNALLVNPRNPNELSEKIYTFIMKPNLRRKIAINGHDFVRSNLSWYKYSREMLNHFKTIIS